VIGGAPGPNAAPDHAATSRPITPMSRVRTVHNELPRPTDAELAILRVLWQHGPSTVRQVRDVLDRTQPTGYTTVLKFFQIMIEKGLVVRDESQRTHVYRARRSEAQTQGQLIGDLVRRAFGGSASKLVMQALASGKASSDELAEIRELIEDLERKRGGDS
jgi:BlaI family penicillinase repressor